MKVLRGKPTEAIERCYLKTYSSEVLRGDDLVRRRSTQLTITNGGERGKTTLVEGEILTRSILTGLDRGAGTFGYHRKAARKRYGGKSQEVLRVLRRRNLRWRKWGTERSR